jgi:hypothetical protein
MGVRHRMPACAIRPGPWSASVRYWACNAGVLRYQPGTLARLPTPQPRQVHSFSRRRVLVLPTVLAHVLRIHTQVIPEAGVHLILRST